MHLSAMVKDMNKYISLDDSILLFIERSESKELEKARKLIKRIRQVICFLKKRDLYRFADQVIVPPEITSFVNENSITPYLIKKECKSDIKEKDIIVQWLSITYSMKDKNPVDSVSFFNKFDTSKSVNILNIVENQKRTCIWHDS